MNYKKIYFAIIKNRRANPLPDCIYGEMHHIIPRSFGGSDLDSNLVRLSAREHFVVHFLLYKMYKHRSQVLLPNSKVEAERYRKMSYAFNMMISVKSKHFSYINSRIFAQIKQEINVQYIKYPRKKVKAMFNFYLENAITEKTMHIINKHFNTTLSNKAMQMLFYRNGLLLSEHEAFKLRRIGGAKKYSVDDVREMFDFCVKNHISSKNIHMVNEKFGTNFLYDSLTRLFLRHNLKLSDYEYFKQRSICNIKYNKSQVQDMFQFYVNNKITKNDIHLFNEHFDTQHSYASILKLFQRHGLKLSDHAFYKRNTYSKKLIKEMFQFYIKNKINSKTMDVLNKNFDTNFKRHTLTELFRSNGLQLRKAGLK